MTSWKLLAPDWSALDTIWRNPLPFVLWPVGNQPLLAHWMDEAVRQGIDEVEIFVPDRPADVRLWLEGGAYWSRKVKITPVSRESAVPAGAQRLDRLPTDPPRTEVPPDACALLQHWFEMQKQLVAATLRGIPVRRGNARHRRLDRRAGLRRPLGPVDPAVLDRRGCPRGRGLPHRPERVHRTARHRRRGGGGGKRVRRRGHLRRQATRASRGPSPPGACSWTCARCVRLELSEQFILSPVGAANSRPGPAERLAALVCSALLAPVAALLNRGRWTEQRVTACENDVISPSHGSARPAVAAPLAMAGAHRRRAIALDRRAAAPGGRFRANARGTGQAGARGAGGHVFAGGPARLFERGGRGRVDSRQLSGAGGGPDGQPPPVEKLLEDRVVPTPAPIHQAQPSEIFRIRGMRDRRGTRIRPRGGGQDAPLLPVLRPGPLRTGRRSNWPPSRASTTPSNTAAQGVPDGACNSPAWQDRTIEARITDPGHFLPDDDAVAALPDDPLAEGGRGAFLMHRSWIRSRTAGRWPSRFGPAQARRRDKSAPNAAGDSPTRRRSCKAWSRT